VNDVDIIIGGISYDFWQNVSITRSMETIADSFSIKVTDKWGEGDQLTKIVPQQECSIQIDGTQVLEGYVDAIAPNFTATSHGFSFVGRSKAGDFVDCSLIGVNELNNITLTDLVRKVGEPFGIGVSALSELVSDVLLPKVTVEPGETVHEFLRRHAQMVGALMTSDQTGRIIISRVGQKSTRTILLQDPGRQKGNIKSGNVTFDDAKRYSSYQAKSQVTTVVLLDDGDSDAKMDAEIASTPVIDKGVSRYRPLLILTENSANIAAATERAEWEMANRIGQAFSVNLTVQGWHDAAGDLWTPNTRVRCQSEILRQNGKEWLIISSVTYKKSLNGGTTCDLTLKRIDAFIPEPIKPKKSGNEGTLDEHF